MRAPVAWYGGKSHLADWIISYFPEHKLYCEPFGGAGSILFAKMPSSIEVYNDIYGDLVNLMRVIQDRASMEELAHRIEYTLYSYSEFCKAMDILADETKENPIERAWAFYTTQNQGFSGKAKSPGDWSRAVGTTGNPPRRWHTKKVLFDDWCKRLSLVHIDARDAIACIKYWDSEDTFFYLDPPYCHDTRVSSKDYVHEYTDVQHKELTECILGVKGKVILSGYESNLYDSLLDNGWKIIVRTLISNIGGKTRKNDLRGIGAMSKAGLRSEYLYINPAAAETTRELSFWD